MTPVLAFAAGVLLLQTRALPPLPFLPFWLRWALACCCCVGVALAAVLGAAGWWLARLLLGRVAGAGAPGPCAHFTWEARDIALTGVVAAPYSVLNGGSALCLPLNRCIRRMPWCRR